MILFFARCNSATHYKKKFMRDPSSPMVAGVLSPITGNFTRHVSDEDLAEDAHVVVASRDDENDEEQNSVLCDLRPGASCGGTPTFLVTF